MAIMAKKSENIKAILGLFFVGALFIIFSYLARAYQENITALVGSGIGGMVIYVLLMTAETVVSPVSLLPLVAVASNLWGPFITGFLNWISWTGGGLIVFYLVREYGKCWIQRLVSLDRLAETESYFSSGNLIINIIVWRSILPDISNYVISLFTNISFKKYLWTTAVGMIPFSFGIAYLGVLDWRYQIIGLIIAILVLVITFKVSSKNKKRKRHAEKLKKELKDSKECEVKA